MKNKKTVIFLVDDDPIFLKLLETQFKERTHYDVVVFSSGEDCLKNLWKMPDIIFLDYYLNPVNPQAHNGLQFLNKIKVINPAIQIVILSSQDRIGVAVDCMKHHAFDYIVKSETAFIRAQTTITFLIDKWKLEKDRSLYKTSSIILSLLIIVLILIFSGLLLFYPF